MKKILLIIIAMFFSTAFWGQNLDEMNETKRKETLLRIAKEIIMEYGPDYYREYGQPKIVHGNVSEKVKRDFSEEQQKKYRNRSYYTVIFLYDKNQESFFEDFSASVYFWGDTGQAFRIYLGNGFGRTIVPERIKSTTEKWSWKKQPAGKRYGGARPIYVKEGEIPEGNTPDIPKKKKYLTRREITNPDGTIKVEYYDPDEEEKKKK